MGNGCVLIPGGYERCLLLLLGNLPLLMESIPGKEPQHLLQLPTDLLGLFEILLSPMQRQQAIILDYLQCILEPIPAKDGTQDLAIHRRRGCSHGEHLWGTATEILQLTTEQIHFG